MKNFKFIDEIIISNGDIDNLVNYNDKKIKIYNDCNIVNKIYSLDRRFICGIRAKNENIIIIDDDIYIQEDELYKLVKEYNTDNNRIVGCFGRNIDKGYNYETVYGEVDVVLTKLLICNKKLCDLFFVCKPLIEDIYKEGQPYGNGEDIFFSFIASIYYERKNFCLKNVKTIELEQNNAVSKNSNHLEYRKKLSAYLLNNYHIFENFIRNLNLKIYHNHNKMKNIICLIAIEPNPLVYNFYKKLKNENTSIYMCFDNNKNIIPPYDNDIIFIYLDNKLCEDNGFKSTHSQKNNMATSREKALMYFCKMNLDYDNIWFIEDDVFIPDENTIENINKKYPEGDLLCASNYIFHKEEELNDWPHWKLVLSQTKQTKINFPYGKSMVCAIRCSKKLLSCIHEYAKKYKNLFMCESLFNTIALHNDLKILAIPELESIYWVYHWNKSDIKQTNLYHPIKSIEVQYSFRH